MLGEQASVSENGTVKTPRRPREYLTEGEIDRLMTIARQSEPPGRRRYPGSLSAWVALQRIGGTGMGPDRPHPQDHPVMARKGW